LIPSTILFIAFDAFDIHSEITLVDGECCPEFDRWLELRRSGISSDFRRIERVGFGLRCLRDYDINLSMFEERSMIVKSDEFPNEIYDRFEDELLIVVKSIPHSESVEKSTIDHEIEKLINVRHPCIAGPIGFVFPIESGILQELKIVRMYLEGFSLAQVLSIHPVWLTSTVKAKMIAGIVLGLRFVHSLGLIHGHLTTNNILFDSNNLIQIVDFRPIILKGGKIEGESESDAETQVGIFSEEEWRQKRDIEAFASILFEILVGRPAGSETSVPTDIPSFVSKIIEIGLRQSFERNYSFHDIFETLKANDFRIEDDVHSAQVSAFVSWVESAE
jgi:hypothetical protein